MTFPLNFPRGDYNRAKAAAAAPTRPKPEATNWAAAPVVGVAVAPTDTDPVCFEVDVAVTLEEPVGEGVLAEEGDDLVPVAAAQTELMSVGTITETAEQMSEANLMVLAWSLSEHAALTQHDI